MASASFDADTSVSFVFIFLRESKMVSSKKRCLKNIMAHHDPSIAV